MTALAWLADGVLVATALSVALTVFSNSGHGGSLWCWACDSRPAEKAGGLCERCLARFQEYGPVWGVAALSEEERP